MSDMSKEPMTMNALNKQIHDLIQSNFLIEPLHINREAVEIFFIPIKYKYDLLCDIRMTVGFKEYNNVAETNEFKFAGKRCMFIEIDKVGLFIGDIIT